MNSCTRCGEKFSHNYLVTMFTVINEKIKKIMVCLKCKEILNKKVENKGQKGEDYKPLAKGAQVKLNIEQGPKGEQAANVVKL